MENNNKKIGTILVEQKYISEDTLTHLLSQSKSLNLRIGETAIELGYITEKQLLEALQQQYQLPILEEKPTVDSTTLSLLPLAFCIQNSLAPYQSKNNQLYIATCDPCNSQAFNEIKMHLNQNIFVSLCSPTLLQEILHSTASQQPSLPEDTTPVASINSESKSTPLPSTNPLLNACNQIEQQIHSLNLSNDNTDHETGEQDSPIIEFVNFLIHDALNSNASDIHLELHQKQFLIRYRIDGILVDQEAPTHEIYPLIISRIKIISGMDIAEKRRPQDGRLSSALNETNIDVRISSLPSIHGETLVLRILNKQLTHLSLETLGMSDSMLEKTKSLVESPNGIILTTGPTGSGKTSTLYSCLSCINSPDKKIITLEDPVEYQLDRINQMNVNPDIGFTFAQGLRHILRQDPDIIMVGEIRDSETADIAIRAALTGHLVFSTLHTNDAISTLSRLLDMGIEPFLLPSTLKAIYSQRLIRKLCSACKKETTLTSPSEIPSSLPSNIDTSFPIKIYEARPQGCPDCRKTGYKGRVGIYELLVINEEVASFLSKGIDSNKALEAAKRNGMVPIKEDCINKVIQGVTSFEEAMRVL